MNILSKLWFGSLMAFFLTCSAHAAGVAEVDITFTNPESYTDIKANGNQNRTKFREDVFFNMETHFKKMAKGLPENYTLKVEVTDIDLAGDTRIGGNNQLRIVKSMYPPRLNFSYTLLSDQDKVLLEDQVILKDMGFMMNRSIKYKRDFFGYEKRMLDKWFEETFTEHLR